MWSWASTIVKWPRSRIRLFQAGEWLRASAYILGSVVLCLVAVWAGYALGAR